MIEESMSPLILYCADIAISTVTLPAVFLSVKNVTVTVNSYSGTFIQHFSPSCSACSDPFSYWELGHKTDR
jgi:hypothetical protein